MNKKIRSVAILCSPFVYLLNVFVIVTWKLRFPDSGYEWIYTTLIIVVSICTLITVRGLVNHAKLGGNKKDEKAD